METIAAKLERKARVALTSARMQWRNLTSTQPVANGRGVAVSLTTYGKRTRQVHLAVESIAAGEMRPQRLILWLDPDDYTRPPKALRRLQRRGLELREAPAGWGPHKKYAPYCRDHADDGLPLVTADDDVLYPPWWLISLLDAAERDPEAIWAHRVRRVTLDGDRLAPYASWGYGRNPGLSLGNVSIGVDGVYFPPRFQQVMRDASSDFLEHAARADDLWLHVHAVRAGVPVGQVGSVPGHFPSLLGSQGGALAAENQAGGRNDQVAAALYGHEDVAVIRGALVG